VKKYYHLGSHDMLLSVKTYQKEATEFATKVSQSFLTENYNNCFTWGMKEGIITS